VVEFQHGELLVRSPLLSPSLGYPILEVFDESSQEPNVRLNIEPATQPTRFSDFQLNEASSSNQSIEATFDFPAVFNHEPTLSTSSYVLLTIFTVRNFCRSCQLRWKHGSRRWERTSCFSLSVTYSDWLTCRLRTLIFRYHDGFKSDKSLELSLTSVCSENRRVILVLCYTSPGCFSEYRRIKQVACCRCSPNNSGVFVLFTDASTV
jgi:hypothetical protein